MNRRTGLSDSKRWPGHKNTHQSHGAQQGYQSPGTPGSLEAATCFCRDSRFASAYVARTEPVISAPVEDLALLFPCPCRLMMDRQPSGPITVLIVTH